MAYRALTVAKTFLDLAKKEGIELTNLQLQKLVFFAHGISLGALNEPLIEDDVKAWPYGPVIPRLYNRLKHYRNDYVNIDTMQHKENDPDPNERVHGDDMRAVLAAWNAYKNKTGAQLSTLSHQKNTPWDIVWNQEGRKFEEIPESIIRDYYKARIVRRDTAKAEC